jgi:hypothetical protein
MDQLLSQLIPTQRIGNDGFNWWVGQVEGTARDEKNNKGGYRFKVRIVGDHPGNPEVLSTADLPWANVMMPVTVPFIPGNSGGAHPQLEIGCWVVGFYLDNDRQKPIIMGSIGQTPGATKVFAERTPDTLPFVTAVANVNVATDGEPLQQGTGNNTATGGLSDGSTNGDGKERVNTPSRKIRSIKDEEWCQSVAEKCDEPDIKSQLTYIIGQFLAEVQNNGGNIGTFLVNEATGKLDEAVGVARKYINKALLVVKEFVARVKGFIIEKLTAGVKDLINALLYPSEDGNSLTPVTEFFNKQLKDLGCQMADLGDRLAEWLTNVLMSYVEQVYSAVACQIDSLVNAVLSKLNSLMEEVLGSILGPLEAILGVIAGPLNLIGGAVNFVLKLLGITCSGPDKECSKYKQVCVNGEEKKKEKDKDFLDDLLGSIDNLFPVTGADYTQYNCAEAYKGNSLSITTVGFTGGVPKDKNNKKIIYDISDITIIEGEEAEFVITRSGYTDTSSSVSFFTLPGSAVENVDYLPEKDVIGFTSNETEKTVNIKTFYSSAAEPSKDFFLVLGKNTPGKGSKITTRFKKTVGKCTIEDKDPTSTEDNENEYSVNIINPSIAIDSTFPQEEFDIPSNPLVDPETGNAIDPATGGIINPITGEITDPTTGNTIDPETGGIINPTTGEITDPATGGIINPTTGEITDPETGEVIGSVDVGTGVVDTTPRYAVNANRSSVTEGEFIVYTITTQNVDNGTILYYTLSGNGITPDDIIGSTLKGSFTVTSNTAKVTIGIETDDVVETPEVLRFTVNGTGAIADVVILPGETLDPEDYEEGTGDSPENTFEDFVLPTVNSDDVITDDNGGIIQIPISNTGDPWSEPPFVFVGGEGIGATATALLDEDGFLSEIRIKSNGYGYKKNLATDKNVRCIIDTFTVIRPGVSYSEEPRIYVNGELGIAQATINDDGFVIGARVLDRTRTFESFPEIVVVGGGGFGAKLLPSLVCLDTEALTTVGSTKIGTGRYVDCP